MRIDRGQYWKVGHLQLGPLDIWWKTPSIRPLFSERYGYDKPIIRVWGYRIWLKWKKGINHMRRKLLKLADTLAENGHRDISYLIAAVAETGTNNEVENLDDALEHY